MKNLLFSLFITALNVSGQEFMVVVKDNKNAPLPFANIIVNSYYGIQTDSLGRFWFHDYEGPQKMEIHKTGYESAYRDHTELRDKPEIILNKLPFVPRDRTLLDTENNIGFKGKDKFLKDAEFRYDLNYEAGIIFDYKDEYKNKLLSNVRVHTYRLGSTDFSLRLNVYRLDSKGIPKENLLMKEIFFIPTLKKQWLDLELLEQNIEFPKEGIAITIELLNPQMKRIKINPKSRPVISSFENKDFKWIYRGNMWPLWKTGTGQTYAVQLIIQ